jgi:GrpB-like predicted nucleotidyltransferase (UPF0157 family)
MEKYGAGSIVVSDNDFNWPTLFEQERTRIKNALGSLALAIEHVGSTAVPGLPSKPIIDLLIGVPGLEEARERCIEPIEALGYKYVPEYASWLPGELFFRKGPPGPWTHHVHLMEPFCPRWEALLVFRDYLRAHSRGSARLRRYQAGPCCLVKRQHRSLSKRKKYFRRRDNSQGSRMARGCRRIAAPDQDALQGLDIRFWARNGNADLAD